jgi:ribosomal protein S26
MKSKIKMESAFHNKCQIFYKVLSIRMKRESKIQESLNKRTHNYRKRGHRV